MKWIATSLALLAMLAPMAGGADTRPAKGKLLVATELVRGDFFAQTVVLLLHYDDDGAMGLVVNRPTKLEPQELLADVDAVSDYRGTIYWGGPVEMISLSALLRTEKPPKGAIRIVDSVYHGRINDDLKAAAPVAADLRLFVGYAGWAAGQLEQELARGSWRIVPASKETVFAEEPDALWKRLTPPREYSAAIVARPSGE